MRLPRLQVHGPSPEGVDVLQGLRAVLLVQRKAFIGVAEIELEAALVVAVRQEDARDRPSSSCSAPAAASPCAQSVSSTTVS